MKRATAVALTTLSLITTSWAAESSIEAQREAFATARAKQWHELMLAPAQRGPNGELLASPAPELPQLKPLALAELRSGDIPALLGADAPLDNWMPSLTYHYAYLDHSDDAAYGAEWLPVQIQQGPLPGARAQRLPDWVTSAVRARVASFKLPSRPAGNPRRQARLLWEGEVDATPGDAMVWSGPAVKTGVARYTVSTTASTTTSNRTTVRLASWPAQAASLINWAGTHGLQLTATLDESALPLSLAQPVPVRLDTAIPVWLVTPQELIPATLKALRTGDACHGGGWIEIEYAGTRQPAIWGTLFLPDAGIAAAATASRMPPEKPSEGSNATFVSRVKVAWPDHRVNALLITAKQFGSVWGTQADVLVVENGLPSARRLSGSGTPACGI